MTVLSPSREVGEFRGRYRWMSVGVALVFFVLAMRLVQVQLYQHRLWESRAARNTTKTIFLPSVRGVLIDRNGEILAGNRLSYDLIVTPSLFKTQDKIESVIALLGLDAEQAAQFRKKLSEIPDTRRDQQVSMLRDISRDQLAAVETHLMEYPGVDVITTSQRFYPDKNLAAHLIGYMGEVSGEELLQLGPDYRSGDRVGRTGIEWKFERQLHGRDGFRREMVDARGKRLQWDTDVDTRDTFKEPLSGAQIELTIDMRLMRDLQKLFAPFPAGGAAIVDVRTGEILALYSKPSVDSNELSAGLTSTRYKELLDDPERPLIDRSIYETYYPGSVFKPFTAFTGLKRGAIRPYEHVTCHKRYQIGRQVFHCNGHHGEVDLHQAIVRSCNVFFWEAAQKINIDDIDTMAADFGFGSEVGLGLKSESAGFLARKAWYVQHFGSFKPGYTLNTAIGQGNTRVTALQVALAYAAIANGGTLWNPTLVRSIARGGEKLAHESAHMRSQINLPPEYWQRIRRALTDVVNRLDGTAFNALEEKRIRIAGKTGTAEVIARAVREARGNVRAVQSHGWFAGFAPADRPQIAIAVVVDHGGTGGGSAAPIALRAMQNYLAPEEKVAQSR